MNFRVHIIIHKDNNDNNNNNNNNNKNDDDDNNNTPVVSKYRVGVRRGVAVPHGQVRVFSLGR